MLLFICKIRKDNTMNNTIKNTIVFTNGDKIIIKESGIVPAKDKVMYQIMHSDRNAVIRNTDGETIIPVASILFATSSPVKTIDDESELDGQYEV